MDNASKFTDIFPLLYGWLPDAFASLVKTSLFFLGAYCFVLLCVHLKEFFRR